MPFGICDRWRLSAERRESIVYHKLCRYCQALSVAIGSECHMTHQATSSEDQYLLYCWIISIENVIWIENLWDKWDRGRQWNVKHNGVHINWRHYVGSARGSNNETITVAWRKEKEKKKGRENWIKTLHRQMINTKRSQVFCNLGISVRLQYSASISYHVIWGYNKWCVYLIVKRLSIRWPWHKML